MNHIDPYDLIRAIKSSRSKHPGNPRLKYQIGAIVLIGTGILCWWIALRK